MNKYPKWPVIVLAVICVALLLFGALGYATYYGDITTNIAASALGINGGLGIENAMDMVFSYKGDATPEDLERNKEVLEKRLDGLGFYDHSVTYDAEAKSFHVEIARGPKSTYTASTIFYNIASLGELEIRSSSEKDADGKPGGELICGNEGLVSAEANDETVLDSLVRYNLTLKFTGEAKKAIRAYTEKALEDASSGTYAIWVDGNLINSRSFNAPITDGVIEAGSSTYSYSGSGESNLSAVAMVLRGGKMAFALDDETMLSVSEPDNSAYYRAILYGLGAVCLLCAVCWVARYRVLGCAAVIGLCGFLGLVLICMTGSFYSYGMYLSYTGLGAFAASVLAGLLGTGYMLRSIRMSLGVASPFKAVDSFIKSRRGRLFAALVCVLAAAIAAYALNIHVLDDVLRPAAICAVSGFLFLFAVFGVCARSFTGFSALREAKYYGGKAE